MSDKERQPGQDLHEMLGPISFQIFVEPVNDEQAAELIKRLNKVYGVARARRLVAPTRGRDIYELSMKERYPDETSHAWFTAAKIALDFQNNLH